MLEYQREVLLYYKNSGAGKVYLWLKMLATKPDDFRLTPGTHRVKGKDQLSWVIF